MVVVGLIEGTLRFLMLVVVCEEEKNKKKTVGGRGVYKKGYLIPLPMRPYDITHQSLSLERNSFKLGFGISQGAHALDMTSLSIIAFPSVCTSKQYGIRAVKSCQPGTIGIEDPGKRRGDLKEMVMLALLKA